LARIGFYAAACRKQVGRATSLLAPLLYHGRGRFCPVCEKNSRKFLAFGDPERRDASCPRCGALERHRLAWLYMSRHTDLFSGAARKMLHIAPEPFFASRLKKRLGKNYLSADLKSRRAMVRMDVTAIPFPDGAFDAIYCSHVLEHVADDRLALREFFRVLRHGAWAIILVPVGPGPTVEDPTIVSPAGRLKAFGQEDHVRRYGPDFSDRLEEAGFSVRVGRVNELFGADESSRMGLTAAAGDIYHCRKA
jgi:SAM-dependent methyltransferase